MAGSARTAGNGGISQDWIDRTPPPPRLVVRALRNATLAVACSVLLLGRSLQAAPANDNFSQSIRLSGLSVRTTGSNVGATRENGEPYHSGSAGGRSVWWSWQAPQTGFVIVSTLGSQNSAGEDLDTVVGIYSGRTLSTLTEEGENDDDPAGNYTSEAVAPVTKDTIYWIAVDGYADSRNPVDSGTIALSLTFSLNAPPGAIGGDAPAWELKDTTGALVKSSDFLGKVVLLNFWATWCGPCIAEMPGLISIQNKHAAEGFTIVGISVDSSPDGVNPPIALVKGFAADHRLNYPNVMSRPRSNIETAYGGIPAIPTTFLIGRDGKIVRKWVGSQPETAFESAITPLLNSAITLQAAMVNGRIRLSWRATATAFRVEGTDNPASPSWTGISAPIQTEGTFRFVELLPSDRRRFFHLASP